jgi:hypothetical protein
MEVNYRSYLESLPTRELVRMADRQGIDIPPGLDRVFVIRELLEYEDEEAGEDSLLGKELQESVSLPKWYNTTFLEVLVRDPLWVFAFWEIRSHDRERFEAVPDFSGYCLRVVFLDDGQGSSGEQNEGSFTVSVGFDDTAWYLGFPPSGGRYRVELCAGTGEKAVLAVSRSFVLPKLLDKKEIEKALTIPLIRLSGAECFSVLHD